MTDESLDDETPAATTLPPKGHTRQGGIRSATLLDETPIPKGWVRA